MLLKVIAIIAFIGACQATEHVYSSQSITRDDSHDEHHGDHEHKMEHHEHKEHKHDEPKVEHKAENKIMHPAVHHVVEHKIKPHGHNDQHHIQKVENKPHHDKNLAEHKNEHHHIQKVEHKNEQNEESKKDQPEVKDDEKKPEKDEHVNNLHTKVIPAIKTDEVHVASAPLKVDSVAQYVQKGSEIHEKYVPATSYQQISRHDVPASPPKDFIDHSGTSKYEFAYEVKDVHTGDHKYQHEARDGHAVKGVYSLHQADGSERTVQYAADKNIGFSAAVKQTTKHDEEKKH